MFDFRPFKSVETYFMTQHMFYPGEFFMGVCKEYILCYWVKCSILANYIMKVGSEVMKSFLYTY